MLEKRFQTEQGNKRHEYVDSKINSLLMKNLVYWILRKAYFTALFVLDVSEKIKWIEHRNSINTVRNREEILEIELKWDGKSSSFSIVGYSLLTSFFD